MAVNDELIIEIRDELQKRFGVKINDNDPILNVAMLLVVTDEKRAAKYESLLTMVGNNAAGKFAEAVTEESKEIRKIAEEYVKKAPNTGAHLRNEADDAIRKVREASQTYLTQCVDMIEEKRKKGQKGLIILAISNILLAVATLMTIIVTLTSP